MRDNFSVSAFEPENYALYLFFMDLQFLGFNNFRLWTKVWCAAHTENYPIHISDDKFREIDLFRAFGFFVA